jgi:hypothetical protein
MNLFQQLKLGLQLFQQYLTPPTTPLKQGKSKNTLGPDTSQAHPSYAEQFLYVNVANRAAQCQIS